MRGIARVVCEFQPDRIVSKALGEDMLKNGFIALSLFCIATVSPCLAQTRVQGQVLSPTPCHLSEKGTADVCAQVVVAVPGKLQFHRVGDKKGKSIKAAVNKDGDFSAKFRRGGRYKVSFDASSVDSDSLKISPALITVRGRKIAQAELFLVAHKSYGAMPAVAISSDCGIR